MQKDTYVSYVSDKRKVCAIPSQCWTLALRSTCPKARPALGRGINEPVLGLVWHDTDLKFC